MTTEEAKTLSIGDYVYYVDIIGGIKKLRITSQAQRNSVSLDEVLRFPSIYEISEEKAYERDTENRVNYDRFLFGYPV